MRDGNVLVPFSYNLLTDIYTFVFDLVFFSLFCVIRGIIPLVLFAPQDILNNAVTLEGNQKHTKMVLYENEIISTILIN